MANAMVGALFATLGLDTAVFQKGLDDADRGAKGFAAGLGPVGDALKTGLTAGFVAAGAAAVAAGGFFIKSGLDALDGAKNITLGSQLANASVTEFQRMAAASATVGIEQDKLADILKDVNDRVGDFLTTGGGPMADFFEQIGPKVGVTAEHFRNLSGPQALGLYVDSLEKAGLNQQEMTFFLEAMASDTTALIPLLKNGGAEMTRLGDAAQASGRVMSESMVKDLMEARLRIDSAKLAFSQMSQVIAGQVIVSSMDFLETLSPMIEQGKALAGQIGEFLGPSFKELAATVQSLMSGPFGQALVGHLKLMAQVIGTVLVVAIKVVVEALNLFLQVADATWRGAATFVENVKTGFEILSTAVPVFIQRMVEGVTSWLQGRLFEVLRGVINRVQQVSDAFFRLYDAVVGNSYVPDMVEEIADWMGPRLREAMVNPALAATAETGSAFSSMAGEIDTQITDIFKSITSKDWSGALGGIFSILGGQAGNMGKIGKLGTAVMGAFGGKIPGFKTGGSFTVGGSGAPDSKIMSMRLSPGEMVDIRRPGQDMGGGAMATRIMVTTNDDRFNAYVDDRARPMAQGALSGARSVVPADMAKANRYSRGR